MYVPEKYIKLVQDMYTRCRTKVRTLAGESSKFNVEVGLHQGSALSPYFFLIVLMDVLTERVRKEAPESMLFADDIVLCGDKDVDMTEYLESWRKALEERGMRVSRPKTQFMDYSFEQNAQGNRPQVKILGEEVERVTHFKFLGTSIEEEGGMETEIAKRVGAGWMNWKKCSGVLCDKRMRWSWRGRFIEQLLDLLCYMKLKPGPPPNDRNQGLRWTRWGCWGGCVEWQEKTKSGTNTSGERRK